MFTSTAGAQHAQTRQGFWFNVGLGAGSLGCDDCGSRTNGLSGQLSLGGTITPRLLLGAGTNGWTKNEDGVTLTMGSLAALVRFYPSTTGGFYLTGGLGIATIDLGVDGYGSASDTGVSALLGIGYDIRVGQNVSLTPFWNGIGGSFDGYGANFGQIGLGLTIH
ncbi:MAG: hypothetical protein ABS52_07080 [Gemmatimonadetes bacterium SCN 70-22]|nr:MAG: hypothetical protein ABS52_07080 [Gemmatimonadetes bacterium SCN 70-22]